MRLDEDQTRGRARHRAQPGLRRHGVPHQRLVGEVAASGLGGARRRGRGDARALGHDRAGDLARRTPRPVPPVRRRRSRRRALPRADRRHRPRVAPAERRVQVLPLLPLPASVHRGGGQAGRARRARRRRRAHPLPRAARRSAPSSASRGSASRRPTTGHAARWSLPIAVAARLVEGKVDLATFESPASAAVRELARRIAWEPLPGARFPERFEAEIVCETKAETETVRIDDVFGNHTRPPGADAVLAKFRANAARSLQADAIASLERAAQRLATRRRSRDDVPGSTTDPLSEAAKVAVVTGAARGIGLATARRSSRRTTRWPCLTSTRPRSSARRPPCGGACCRSRATWPTSPSCAPLRRRSRWISAASWPSSTTPALPCSSRSSETIPGRMAARSSPSTSPDLSSAPRPSRPPCCAAAARGQHFLHLGASRERAARRLRHEQGARSST